MQSAGTSEDQSTKGTDLDLFQHDNPFIHTISNKIQGLKKIFKLLVDSSNNNQYDLVSNTARKK